MPAIRAKLISAHEVRQRFGDISESTLYRWVRDGAIPRPLKINRRDRLWDARELDDFLSEKKAGK